MQVELRHEDVGGVSRPQVTSSFFNLVGKSCDGSSEGPLFVPIIREPVESLTSRCWCFKCAADLVLFVVVDGEIRLNDCLPE